MRKREALGILFVAISIFLLVVCLIIECVSDEKKLVTGQAVSNKTLVKYNYEKGAIIFYEKG